MDIFLVHTSEMYCDHQTTQPLNETLSFHGVTARTGHSSTAHRSNKIHLSIYLFWAPRQHAVATSQKNARFQCRHMVAEMYTRMRCHAYRHSNYRLFAIRAHVSTIPIKSYNAYKVYIYIYITILHISHNSSLSHNASHTHSTHTHTHTHTLLTFSHTLISQNTHLTQLISHHLTQIISLSHTHSLTQLISHHLTLTKEQQSPESQSAAPATQK